MPMHNGFRNGPGTVKAARSSLEIDGTFSWKNTPVLFAACVSPWADI